METISEKCEKCGLGRAAHADTAIDHAFRKPKSNYVVLETMPDCWRELHRKAGNFGVYPHNGAEREVVTRWWAEQVVAGDPDQYARIVRDATDDDVDAIKARLP